MSGFPSPFRSSGGSELFDDYDEFVPEHVPEPGTFLDGHDILAGEDHVAFHETTREVFEERTVYDMTFNYNLARLNLDTRHPNAGYRFAEDADDPSTLRAEFTPTTPFCPQTDTLTRGSFRAWNELRDRHDYDLVTVRVHPTHHQSAEINDNLADLADTFRETDQTRVAPGQDRAGGSGEADREAGKLDSPGGYDAPF